jgi:hypothetical protein
MKVKVVPALRSKRGLRPVRRVAEPQVVGLAPQATKEKKADTMKTYLLKKPATVEPKARRPSRRQTPSTPTSLAGVSSRGSQPRVLFLGLDVHTESIAVVRGAQ